MTEAPAAPSAEPTVGRDVRVDTIGFVGELEKPFDKDLRTALKLRMVDRQLNVVEGEYFNGLLVTPDPVGTIEPRRWLRLLKAGKLTEEQFLSAIAVGKDKARQVVSVREVDRLCTFADAQPKLTVARRKGVDVTLAQALAALTKAAG